VDLTEPCEMAVREKMALRPSLPFVFIDLREDPEAWGQIENELAEDVCSAAH
jgi:hypothetical protein